MWKESTRFRGAKVQNFPKEADLWEEESEQIVGEMG